MSDLSRYRALAQRERAMVALAVLIDGHDAPQYFLSDKERFSQLSRAAKDLIELKPEERIPVVGTLLRMALEQT